MTAPEEPTTAELAAYIGRMLAGLHEIAGQRSELAMLAYILDLAAQEAAARAKDAPP